MKNKKLHSEIYKNNFEKNLLLNNRSNNNKINGKNAGLRKWAAKLNKTKIGYLLIDRITSHFPDTMVLPNKISWFWNRFRDPAVYKSYADSRKWIFILGCSNSGTTLLHDLLAFHSEIGSLPLEGQSLTRVLPRPKDLGFDRRWSENPKLFTMTEDDTHYDSARLIHDWKNCLDNINASTILEKTPINVARTRWLQSVFKNSYFIGIVRDGRAVAEGITRRSYGNSFSRAIEHWKNVNDIMLENAKYLKHFRFIKYEDLVKNPRQTIFDLLKFIKIDENNYKHNFEDELLIHNINEEPAAITDFNQKSFDRIPKEIFDQLTDQIKPMMQRLGYGEF
jgi:hypothetical protein